MLSKGMTVTAEFDWRNGRVEVKGRVVEVGELVEIAIDEVTADHRQDKADIEADGVVYCYPNEVRAQ